MFSVYRKFLPIKISAVDSIVFSLVLLHKNHNWREPISSINCKIQCFVNLCTLVDSGLPSKTVRKSRKSEKRLDNQESCTVPFLINSCGLPPEMAVSVSQRVRFECTEKPALVVTILKKYGLSKKQIADVVRKRPNILLSKEKTLLPKFEFFRSVGFPMARLANTICKDPSVLARSLENQIIPSYNFLKSVLVTNERVATAMERSAWSFVAGTDRNLAPNVAVLRELNVPDSCILYILTYYPETFVRKTDEFTASVKEVLGMGFDPSRSTFVLALHVVAEKVNRVIWDRSFKAYSNWGWSKDDIYSAFRKHPNCMIMSENKISKTMDFLVNKMGWDTRIVLNCPTVLFFNLQNRIIPRCNVIRVLLSRGLIDRQVNLGGLLKPLETCFLKRFVTKYEVEVPELYDVYKGKIGLEELESLKYIREK